MTKFSLLVVLAVASTVNCLTDEQKEMAASLHATCVEETGVDEALIAKASVDKVLMKDPKLECYIKCLLEQMGCLDDNGAPDVEAMIALIPDEFRERAAPTMRKCGSKAGANHCETAWLAHQCYIEEDPDSYFLI